jgi:hypothetical protein
MQLNEARELQRMRRGIPCKHHEIEKEYHLGTDTGDYVCTTCGQAGWGNKWNEDQSEPEMSQQAQV